MWNFLHFGLLGAMFVHKGATFNLSKKGPATLSFVLLNVSFVFTCGAGVIKGNRGLRLLFFFTGLEMAWSWDFDVGGHINLSCTADFFPKCPNIKCVS